MIKNRDPPQIGGDPKNVIPRKSRETKQKNDPPENHERPQNDWSNKIGTQQNVCPTFFAQQKYTFTLTFATTFTTTTIYSEKFAPHFDNNKKMWFILPMEIAFLPE